ncbi:protein FAM160A1 [Alosa sapidissima]|uniref:protein FAM160A1 n=1 Tax=Alosa sapidissima TaxID=34773 RepID=UPI001C082B86|nr:protein FAM160A1 [Alosa sapidissima]
MMASVVASGNRGRAQRLRGVDPETCMIVFKNHWAQVLRVLERYDPGRGGAGSSGPIPADEASAVQNYAEHMLVLLMEEPSGDSGAMGPILEFVVLENVMERLFLWSLRRQFTDDMKLEQLRMYSMLIGQAQQPLLHHKPILRPLMMLLSSCSASGSTVGPNSSVRPSAGSSSSSAMGPSMVEAELVGLLHQLCFAVAQDPSVLELFFHTSEDQGAANFLLFSLLIPYTHREGPVGDKARNALLLIMSLSAHNCRVANHIAEQTYFCPVLATGLSGLYSSLPARLEVYSEDWHSLQPADWLQVPSLIHFLHSLQFCSTVSQVAHPSIKSQLLGYIYNGFLVPVVAPALHKLTLEEVMTSTAYLELFLRSISDPALLHTFLSFILMHRHDNVHILDTLVSRINTPFQLGTVSLALFRTLIGLHCEDVMLQLILRFLIPCTHVLSGVRERLRERDCYSSSAAALLSLTPSFLHQSSTQQDCILWTKVTEGFLKGNMGLDDLLTSSATVGYWRFLGGDSLTDSNYLQYLREAHDVVGACVWACQVWSAPYDGLRPSPEDYREEEEERQQQGERQRGGAEREREEEDGVLPFISSSQALSPAATPVSVSISASISAPPPAADTSSGGQSAELEWEWDDMFESGMECVEAEAEQPAAARAVEPPQHLVEMRRSAISLVQGSYVEEAEFQDDVLVYSLIAQRDSRARAHTPAHAHTHAAQVSTNNQTHNSSTHATVQSARIRPRKAVASAQQDLSTHSLSPTDTQKHCDAHSHTHAVTQSAHSGAHTLSTVQSACTHSHAHTHQQTGSALTNGLGSEMDHSGDNTNAQTSTSTQDCVQNGLDHNCRPSQDYNSKHPQDFVSQCLELIQSLGWEAESIMGDEEFRERVQRLSFALQEEAELSFEYAEPLKLTKAEEDRTKNQKQGQDTPFTGPFISVLLSRLENLVENSIEVNLLVTGILAQLAAFPQPLLRSFLLSTQPFFQPGVRTLYQVLVSVRDQLERYAEKQTGFAELVREAGLYLLARDQALRERERAGENGESWFPIGQVLRPLPRCPKIPPAWRSRVYAAVLFGEFLKELSALAQEHTTLLDPSEG